MSIGGIIKRTKRPQPYGNVSPLSKNYVRSILEYTVLLKETRLSTSMALKSGNKLGF